ncbi:MAG: Fur family transcriptional regulator [Candidatus Nanoarchaeia archaeon]
MVERQTPQKRKIMEYLFSTKSHPSAEMVYNKIKDDVPGISPATVYRNLQQLASEEKIQRFCFKKEFRFDADTTEHSHLVCRICGRIFDLKASEELFEKYKKQRNHKIEKVQVICYGVCSKCNNGE